MQKLSVLLFALFVSVTIFATRVPLRPPLILNPKSEVALIQGFSPMQEKLWYNFLGTHPSYKPKLDDITVFVAITHALETVKLHDGGSGLSLIREVKEIAGDIPEVASARQFNLTVQWIGSAPLYLERSNFSYRIGWGHDREWGLSKFSSSHGLHVLFSKENPRIGHVHIDYRKVTTHGTEGHYQPYNADVRAVGPEKDLLGYPIDNYGRYVQFFGPIPNYER